jgi:hypothetical protein
MRKGFVAIFTLLFCFAAAAQQVLNNDAIIKLVKAGLSDDLIVTTINSQSGAYDTSADAIIALKSAGVSDRVVAAIVAKTAPPVAPTAAATATPAPSEKSMAMIHIYRYKQYYGSALRPSIYWDDESQGRLSNGRYIDVQIKPGEHTIYADDKQAGAAIKAEAGQDYYLRADVATGFWKGHFRLTMMLPEQGKYDMAKLKPEEKQQTTDEKPEPH